MKSPTRAQPRTMTKHSMWNRVGARVALLATSVAATASLAGGMSEFKSMDANGDGRVTSAEHAAAAKSMFDAMDADKDGKVTAAEMDAAQAKVTGKKAAASGMGSADKIRAIDTDGDGALTAEEHAAGSRKMFAAMDGNGDGALSAAELEAGHAKMLGKKAK